MTLRRTTLERRTFGYWYDTSSLFYNLLPFGVPLFGTSYSPVEPVRSSFTQGLNYIGDLTEVGYDTPFLVNRLGLIGCLNTLYYLAITEFCNSKTH